MIKYQYSLQVLVFPLENLYQKKSQITYLNILVQSLDMATNDTHDRKSNRIYVS